MAIIEKSTVASNIKNRTSGSLIGEIFNTKNESQSNRTIYKVKLNKIIRRSVNEFGQRGINNLAKAIKLVGLVNPIVLGRLSNLDKNDKLYTEYESKKIVLDGYEYFIVAGERRYRAYQQLREEDLEANKNVPFFESEYESIEAFILEKDEMDDEENIYKFTNTENRQLNPYEALLQIKDIITEASTPDGQVNAINNMNNDKGWVETNGLVKKFNMVKFVQYYLENELGYSDWSASTIKNYVRLLNCHEDVTNAIFDSNYPIREALVIAKYPKETQKDLIATYLKNSDRYKKELSRISQPIKKVSTIETEYLAKKKAIKKYLMTVSNELETLSKNMDSELKEECQELMLKAFSLSKEID